MQKALVIVFILLATGLSAQEPAERRHEVGFDISGYIVNLLGGSRHQPDVTFTYKRVLGDWALRSSFHLESRESESHRLHEVREGFLWYHRNRDHRASYVGRVGLEHRRPLAGRVMAAFGVDLVYGYSPYSSRVQAFAYEPGVDPNFPDNPIPVPGVVFLSQQPWEQVKRTDHHMGLDGTVALLFPLNERLMLSTKIRSSLHYRLYWKRVERFVPETVTTERGSELAMSMGPRFISELNMYFRF